MASTHGGQQDRSNCGKHNFHIHTPIEVIFVLLESSRSVEQHQGFVNFVHKYLTPKKYHLRPQIGSRRF
jgi:hypothetical protein